MEKTIISGFGVNKLNLSDIKKELQLNYSEENRKEYMPGTSLTIAEYDYLFRHIQEYTLNNYMVKIQQYSKCRNPFETIIKWAFADCNWYFCDITQGGEDNDL